VQRYKKNQTYQQLNHFFLVTSDKLLVTNPIMVLVISH